MNLVTRFLAMIILIITLPFLIILMVIIRMESKGNPIFKQIRVGKGGKYFTIYKLRTMKIGEEPKHIQTPYELKKHEEHRITCTGKKLRKCHIDEIPQLWNIIKNEMTFVGPRPFIITLAKNRCYYAPANENVLPGLTGLVQISKMREINGYNVSRLDRFYCKKKCLLLDTSIVLKTMEIIMTAK